MEPLLAYRHVRLIRRFEERLVGLKTDGLILGSMHLCNGQEAIPVGACACLEQRDALTVTYRGHGWAIARGLPLAQLFAELQGRASELSGGLGGSPYFCSARHGFLGENSIVGAGVPIAMGAALASYFDGSGSVSLVAIGDGALNQGAVHEGLNMAGTMRLPLVVVVENNVYSELTPVRDMIPTATLVERAPMYGMAPATIDGNDVDAVESAVRQAVERARSGGGPSLIEAHTERLVGHYDLDPQHYRPAGEIEDAMTREPVGRLRSVIGDAEADRIDDEVEQELDAAVAASHNVPFPTTESVTEHLYA
ncbi:thiamine pyrophosphate-dependent dehydrogenase E1 component subunit alpha [Gaiella occulta]|nr:thiamine pyrophosphate-dependent dehydrogenase E1 component subunit alpha [Gaiella occulta]